MSGDELLVTERPSLNDDEASSEPVPGLLEKPFKLTMEVPFFFMFFATSVSGAVVNNMLLQRTCVTILGYNESVCDQLQVPGEKSNETRHLESEVQKYTTILMMVKAILENVFPAVLSLFLGVWSNTHGRRPLFVWPLCGYAITSILVVMYSLLDGWSPWWFLLTAVPFSLCGGSSTLFTGAFCYCSDVSSTENRSFRLAVLESSILIGSILGSLASPYAVAAMGTQCLLLFTAALAVSGYVYANIWIAESILGAVRGGLRSVFQVSLIKDMCHTCFMKRPNYDRFILFLLILPNCLAVFVLYGLMNIDYLYTRKKIMWTLKEYSFFSAANTVTMVIGLLFGVTVLQKKCKISDILLTMVAFFSSVTEVVARALATQSWHMYFGSSVSFLRGLSSPLIRSLLSKRVSTEDIAKVFALISTLEAVLPVLAPLMFNLLYTYTLTTFPGAVYLLAASIYASCFTMAGLVQFLTQRYPAVQYAEL